MERNWLIRTTQHQILGPISKEKVVEFFNKGALGPEDELCSGNGYWFSIKEKDLIEKYLIGDIPQGFNPISEAPTVLSAKNKNEGTSSLNRTIKTQSPDQTLVLNRESINESNYDSQSNSTLVINVKDLNKKNNQEIAKEEVKIPKNDDLDYPDMSSVKVPDRGDLDYPDMEPSKSNAGHKPSTESAKKEATAPKYKMQSAEDILSDKIEPVHLPKDEDLAYPDLSPTKQRNDFKMTDNLLDSGLSLALDDSPKPETVDEATKTQFMATSPGSAKAVLVPTSPVKIDTVKKEKKVEQSEAKPLQIRPQEERKLLVERKKASSKENVTQEINAKDLKKASRESAANIPKRNDTYFFLIVALLIIIILGVLFYYREILNKPLPV